MVRIHFIKIFLIHINKYYLIFILMEDSNKLISKKKKRNNSADLFKNTEAGDNGYNSDNGVGKINGQLNTKYLTNKQKGSYRLLEPFRALGVVIDDSPIVFYKRATERFMLASNGNSFLLYNLEHLRLERISPPLPNRISALAIYKNKVFTATGGGVLLWDKIHIVKEYTYESNGSEVVGLTVFDNLLLALNDKGDLVIFDIHSTEVIKVLQLGIETFIHPSTYLNKILFTKKREQYEKDLNIVSNKLYLYNINAEKQIFEFNFDIKDATILTIEQSPVIDVIGIGFSSGDIVVFNLKTFKKLISFKADSRVEHLSFSNCLEMGLSLLATSNTNGDINIWDLNKKLLHYTIQKPFSSVSNLTFLPNEPILLATSGMDNYIKMFKFELNTGVPVLLKSRNGHSKHPHKIRFYGESINNDSNHILSMSGSEFRNISLINEHMSKEVSFKNIPKTIKHNNIQVDLIDFDFNEFRQRDWNNILVNFSGSPVLCSYENNTVNEKPVELKTKSRCSSICVSMCGNFGFAGFENGNIEKFNMQSGISRWLIEKGHSSPVICLKSDGINSLLVSISLDSTIKFWDIFQSSQVKTIELVYTPELLELNRDNDLVAVSLSNGDIKVYDKSNFKLVREFNKSGSYTKVHDVVFSRDGKWLLFASNDKCLRIYDILSGNKIEWIEFKHMPVSIAISPSNQYIALTYSGLKGIHLWLNRSMFIDFVDVEEVREPVKVLQPFNDSIRKLKTRKDLQEESVVKEELPSNQAVKVKEQNKVVEANMDLICLSKENKLKFKILQHLEEIQEKNEPKIKKKEKNKAPFFLFNINEAGGESSDTPEYLNILKNFSHFKNEKALENSLKKGELGLKILLAEYEQNLTTSGDITLFLNSVNPYIVDLEIRNLDPVINSDDNKGLLKFLDYILAELTERSNFELVQAYLNRFLKVTVLLII
jgi:U3 small nucleolar RNA-associated protein 21